MKKKEKKSMQDIYRQAGRLARKLYGSKTHPKGWITVMRIQEVYLTNIAQHFGYAAWHDFSSESCESMHNVEMKIRHDDMFMTAVGREVYAHPFDWGRIRKISSMKELISLAWSLHWMGYDLKPDSCTFEDMKADLIRIADSINK